MKQNLLYRARADNGLPANDAWVDSRRPDTNNLTISDFYGGAFRVAHGNNTSAYGATVKMDSSELAPGDAVIAHIERSLVTYDESGVFRATDSLALALSTSPTGMIAVTNITVTLEPGETGLVELTVPENFVPGGDLYLRLRCVAALPNQFYIAGARLHKAPLDDLGIFDGDTEDSDGYSYQWTGAHNNSPSVAVLASADIEITPEPPTFTDNVEEGGGEWTTPYLEGVTYSPQSGLADPGQTVTVTATALEGYTLVGETSWSHVFPEEPEPEPEEPEPEDPDPEDPDPEEPDPEPEEDPVSSPVINLVKRPILDQSSARSDNEAWLTSTVDSNPAQVGGSDRFGRAIYGLALDNTTANALIEVPEGYGVDPLVAGDELAIWLTGYDSVTAGLYRERTAQPTAQVAIDPKSSEEPGAILEVPEGEGELWLKLEGGSVGYASRVRLSPAYPVDSLGIFDGSEEGTEELTYGWTGAVGLSPSVAMPVGWEPEPEEPEPVDPGETVTALAAKVATYLDMPEVEELAKTHVETVLAYVYGYTRGRGFIDQIPAPDLQQVIIAATARLTANPEQTEYYQTGDYSERPARLSGWTLLELAVLNQYRVRWA